ncbi:hypothetical protein CF104_15355 [Aeromonas jandaei]|nr:hypothetical protein CF104_15355 [Aeromonas jandaei]
MRFRGQSVSAITELTLDWRYFHRYRGGRRGNSAANEALLWRSKRGRDKEGVEADKEKDKEKTRKKLRPPRGDLIVMVRERE